MGTVLVNYSGKTRRATLNGREYIVARCTLIVPGVLNGSKGALYYPPDEIAKNHDAWNGIPLTKGHPSLNGANVSARSPDILQSHGLGHVFNVGIAKGGRLRGEAWFDVKSCERVAPEVLNKLKAHEPIELSTGLFTNDRLAENGAHYNGKKYTHVARDYRPDHLAILLDQLGACSLRDGCGVMVDNAMSKMGDEKGASGSTAMTKMLAKVSGAKPFTSKVLDDGMHHHFYSDDPKASAKKVVDHFAAKGMNPEVSSEKGLWTVEVEMDGEEHIIHFIDGKAVTNCVLNESNVCVNCGGPGSGKPGPCPTGAGQAGQGGFPSKHDGVVYQTKEDRDSDDAHVDKQKAKAAKFGAKAAKLKARLEALKAKGPNTAKVDALKADRDTRDRRIAELKQRKEASAAKIAALKAKLTGNHVVNGAGICVNCGGPGSGKPGPCPSATAEPPKQTPIAADREQAARAHKLGTDATDTTSKLLTSGVMGQMPNAASRNALTPVMDSTRRANKRAVLGSPNGIGQTAKAVVQAQKAHEKASSTLLDLAQSDPGAAYEMRKAAAKHDLAAKSFGEMASRMKPTGNAMTHTLNAAGFCVNCGGKGGKPGPCPTFAGIRSRKRLRERTAERDSAISDKLEKTSFEIADIPFGKKKTIEGRTVERGKSDLDIRVDGITVSGPDAAARLIHGLKANSKLNPGDDMATKKEKMVQFLTANCDCWKEEKDAEILSNFDEDKLKTLVDATKAAKVNDAALNEIRESFGAEAEGLTANAMPAFVKGKSAFARSPSDEEEAAEGEAEPMTDDMVPAKKGKKKMAKILGNAEEPAKPPTLNEWLATAPVEVQEVIRTAQAVETGAKEKIVKTLVGNSSAKSKADRENLAKFLMAKPLAELTMLSKLSVNRAAPAERNPMDFLTQPARRAPEPVANYGGLGEDFEDDEPTGNEDTALDEVLEVPTVNWAEEAKLAPTGSKRGR